jgi:hypothetical protein
MRSQRSAGLTLCAATANDPRSFWTRPEWSRVGDPLGEVNDNKKAANQ